jgi:integrase
MTRTEARPLTRNVKTIESVLAKPVTGPMRHKIKGENGLLLAIYPSGKATWLACLQVGKGAGRRRFTREIGDARLMSLADASSESETLRIAAKRGEEPGASALRSGTFGELFGKWLTTYAKDRKRSWREDERRYKLHLEGPLGKRPVAEITRGMLIERLHAVAKNAGPIQANRVAALLSVVFVWALDNAIIDQTPAFRLPKLGEETARERFLSPDEISAFWHGLDDAPMTPSMRLALRLMLVTGQRRGEIISMRKADLALDGDLPVWTIPAPASKNKNPHRVPLTPLALSLIKEALALSGSSPYVFPSPSEAKTHMWETAPTKAMGRTIALLGFAEPAWPHDLRRTVSTNLARLRVPRPDAERVLNHVKGAKSSTFGKHYDQHSYDDEKYAALVKWERELRRIVGLEVEGNIVELKRA